MIRKMFRFYKKKSMEQKRSNAITHFQCHKLVRDKWIKATDQRTSKQNKNHQPDKSIMLKCSHFTVSQLRFNFYLYKILCAGCNKIDQLNSGLDTDTIKFDSEISSIIQILDILNKECPRVDWSFDPITLFSD